jgi:hypothetical protein
VGTRSAAEGEVFEWATIQAVQRVTGQYSVLPSLARWYVLVAPLRRPSTDTSRSLGGKSPRR